MKTKTMKMAGMLSVSILLCTAGVSAFADGMAAAKEKSYTGTISAVDAKEKTVRVKEFLFHKTFVLGDNCVLALGDNKNAPITDLREGEKVRVSYQNASGVLVADRIEQEKLTFFGEVQSVDPSSRTLTAKQGAETKKFILAGECRIRLHDHQGALQDIQPGSRVTVTYEIPGDELVARQIEDRSKVFVGKLEAFDAPDRTLKASRLLENKKFNLADGCAIIIDGRTDARPDELKVGQKYELSYDNVDGVNVVNRIAVWESPKDTSMTQKSSSPTPGQGYGY